MSLDPKLRKVLEVELERMTLSLSAWDEILRESGDVEQRGLAEDDIFPALHAVDDAYLTVKLLA